MSAPRFSLIMPTYNRGYVIWKTIQAVIAQTLSDWELLVIDDGSTDDTQKVLAAFQDDSRIRTLQIPNGGAAAARNYGLEQARGELIGYIDSDDLVYPNFLSVMQRHFTQEIQLPVLDIEGMVFAIPNYNRRLELVDDHGTILAVTKESSAQKLAVTLQDYFHWNVYPCGTGLMHTRAPVEAGLRWDTNMQILEDIDFILQLGTRYPDGFHHIPYALFDYAQRYGSDGICSNVSYAGWADAFEALYHKHQDDPLMKGQAWYPDRVTKYRQRQKDFEAGTIGSQASRYFPEFFKSQAR